MCCFSAYLAAVLQTYPAVSKRYIFLLKHTCIQTVRAFPNFPLKCEFFFIRTYLGAGLWGKDSNLLNYYLQFTLELCNRRVGQRFISSYVSQHAHALEAEWLNITTAILVQKVGQETTLSFRNLTKAKSTQI